MSETCCMRLAENTGRKNRHFGTIAQLCRAISLELRHVWTIGIKVVKHWYLLHMSDNMVNFGLLTAEICWRVWGTPANFNSFHILAALLHVVQGTLVVGVSQAAALNRGHHLYSAGRPSRWALAHILVTEIKQGIILSNKCAWKSTVNQKLFRQIKLFSTWNNFEIQTRFHMTMEDGIIRYKLHVRVTPQTSSNKPKYDQFCPYQCSLTHTHNRFYDSFSGTAQVSQCQKKSCWTLWCIGR